MFGAGGQVDIVKAHGDGRRDAQLWGGSEQVFIDFFREKANQRLFISDAPDQFLAGNALGVLPIFHFEMLVQNFARRFEQGTRREDFGLRHASPQSAKVNPGQ